MHYRKIFLIAIIAFLVFTAAGCNKINNTAPSLEKGVLDLRNLNLAETGIIALDGEWDFYWNELLSYHDLRDKEPDIYATVPEVWNKYKIGDELLNGTGFATYRLRVKTDLPKGSVLAIKMKTVSSSYRLYINDEYLAGSGTVGTKFGEEKGEYNPQSVVFRVPDKEFDIIIQVSNFHYARGGLWDSIYLGDVNQIHYNEDWTTSREAFILGILLIMALFYLAIFFLLKELKYTLYFSLLALSAAISIDTLGEFILVYSAIPFRAVICIWYSTTAWMTLFLVLFMHELFPSKFSRISVKIYLCVVIVFQLIYIFVDPIYYSKYAFFSNYSEIIATLIALVIVLIGARKGYKNWLLNAISIIALPIGYISDLMDLTSKVGSPANAILYWSALVALFLQMITQAQRIKTYFDNKASAELLLLQAQIKPHFLYNTVNTIISVSRTNPEKARSLLIDFSQYLRKSFDFKGSSQLVPLSDELELSKAYIAIEKARFGNRLNVNFNINGDIEHINVPILVLQPIIENAIIHGILPKPEGGSVDISISRDGQLLSFIVKDNGVGISNANQDSLLKAEGHHIGLSNIDARIRRLYKQGLKIESGINGGTEVKWCTLIR